MEPQSTIKNQALPLSELLPGLSGILSKDEIQSLTAKKQPRPRATMAHTRTAEKTLVKPLTYAEMMPDLAALKPYSPRRNTHMPLSERKKGWNSSVKVERKITLTANGQMKNNPVRKVLNFQQPKPKTVNPRFTTCNSISAQTPKFPKPEFRPKKSLHIQAKANIRISGVFSIPETPVGSVKTSKKTISQRSLKANKENIIFKSNVVPPTPILKKPIIPIKKSTPVPDTPNSNAGSDSSFLLKEKEINDIEAKIHNITKEKMLENIAEISPPISTPFKEYRSVQEYFNNTSEMENSVLYNDNTIMCFDKPSISTENKREESVIVSLCDLFNKAAVTKPEMKEDTELNHLIEREQQTEKDIKVIENVILMLNNMKESQVKTLNELKDLISKKRKEKASEDEKDKTLVIDVKKTFNETLTSPTRSPILSRPCSVIRSTKSPSYKIPKKNLCLRKKIICKSMPNVSSSGLESPIRDFEGKALNVYMRMKEQMHFLSTPKVNRTDSVPDTPALTSHNLQKQLEKLYG